MLFVSLVALVAACVFSATASAVVLTPTNSPLPGSTFQGGDGNQADPDGAGSLRDWQNIAGSATTATDNNALDSMFEGGDKETEPYHWAFENKVDGVTPSKSNLFSAWTHNDPTSNDVFLNLAFQREASTGNTFATFELNQRTDSWVNDRGTAIPCRTTGDILISYEVQSGGSPPNVDVIIYKWTSTTTNGAQGCGRTGTFLEINPQPFAQGAVNPDDITNFLPGAVLNQQGKIEEGTWGESTINLTGLFQAAFNNPCFSFGQVQMHTRSSTSIDSQLQDFISPVPVLVRSCAIQVVKSGPSTVHHGDQMSFTFDVTNVGNVALGNITVSDDKCPAANTTGPVKTGGDQDNLLEGVEHWVYTCTYPVPAHSAGEADPIINTVTARGMAGTNSVSDTDTHSTDIVHPDIEIDKKVRRNGAGTFVDGPIDAHRGDTLNYRFSVTNPGDTALTVQFSDARCDSGTLSGPTGDTNTNGKLDTTETWIYTCSHLVTGADPDPFTNHACVTGTDALGGPHGSDTDCDDTTTDILDPDIEIDKKVRVGSSGSFVNGPVHARVGNTLEYEFTVTNPGDTALTVMFSDARCDSGTLTGPTGDTDSDGKLDTSETWLYHCSHVVLAGDADPFTNHACVTGTDSLGGTDTDCDDTTTEIDKPGIEIDKKVRRNGTGTFVDGPITAKVGDTLNYQFTVTNTGDVPLTVVLTDARCDSTPAFQSGDTDADGKLDTTETWIYTCNHVIQPGDDDPFTNHACVVGTPPVGSTVNDCDDTTTDILKPGIHIDKKVSRSAAGPFSNGPVEARRDDTLYYQFTVTNTGDTPLSVVLTDARCDSTPAFQSGDTDADGKLDLTETWVYTCSHVVQSNDPDPFTNHACAVGTDSLGQTDEDCDDTTTDLFDPGIDIEKTLRRGSSGSFVDGPINVHRGDTIEYRFVVTNTGDVPLSVVFDDPRCDTEPTSPDSGDTDSDGKLDLTETWVYSCSHLVTGGDPDPLPNTATATGTDSLGQVVDDEDSAEADILEPGIHIDKKVRRGDSGAFVNGPIDAKVGDTLEYELTVTNTGDAPLTVVFDDPRCDTEPTAPDSGDTDADGKLDTSETWIYHCSHLITAGDDDPFENTACVTGTDVLDGTDEDCDTTTTDVLKPNIEIDKKLRRGSSGTFVDGPINVHVNDTIDYEFTVTNEGDTALSVVFDDPRCDTEPTTPDSGDTDADGKLDLTETWIYHCSHLVTGADPDPLPNTATVVGTDSIGQTDTDDDSAAADILHPAIKIDKKVRRGASDRRGTGGSYVNGPIDATVGDTLEYEFTVTNEGDTPLDVVFDDPRCDTEPTAPDSGDTDADGKLDTTETWIYHCSHLITDGDDDPFENTACVTGTDVLDGSDEDCDSTTTDLLHPGIHIDKKVSTSAGGPFVNGPIDAKRGDTLHYEFTVTNTGDTSLSVAFHDPRCDTEPDDPDSGDTDADGRLDLTETWIYHCSHVLTAGDPDPFENTACVTGTDVLGGTDEDCDTTTTDVFDPAIHIEKTVRAGSSGAFGESVKAHVGDTLEYRFEVTNTGDVPLEVTLSDPKCDSGTLSGPSGDSDSDGKLDLSETWVYSCSHRLTSSDLAAGSEFPNVATANGTDSQNQHVSDDDGALATILDPRIKVDKLVRVGTSGAFADAVSVEVGQTLTYQLTVTNTGNTPLAVNLSDPRCDGSPEFKGGDSDGDSMLDLSETWVYECSHVVTASDPDPLVNTATADGTDEIGGHTSDDDTATADILPPVGEVAPETVRPGLATLTGRTGCVGRSFTARVSGRSIVKVVFKVDGRTVKTLRKPNSGSRFTYKVDPRKLRNGAHRLEATVSFDAKTGTKAKRLRVTFLRCAKKVAPPRFTG